MYKFFDNSLINMNAVSQVTKGCFDGKYKILMFRLDGSFMASQTYASEEDMEDDFDGIFASVLKRGIMKNE